MSDVDLLVRVSRLYFELGETQERIGELLGVTRPQVSRLLKEARSEGIVEIRIIDRGASDDGTAELLRARFDLHEVVAVPRLAGPEDLTRRLVGRAAADHLRATLREGMVVGAGAGASLNAVVDALADAPASTSVTVVPLAGGVGMGLGANETVRRLAQALGGYAQEMPAPGLLQEPATRDALLGHVAVQNIVRMWSQLDVALYGIGARVWTEPWFGAETLQQLDDEAAVGEILIRPFDLWGRRCAPDLGRRVIGLDPAELPRVRTAMAVASGDVKVAPILGALRAGYVRTLVTDRDTAQKVLDLDDATRPGPVERPSPPAAISAAAVAEPVGVGTR